MAQVMATRYAAPYAGRAQFVAGWLTTNATVTTVVTARPAPDGSLYPWAVSGHTLTVDRFTGRLEVRDRWTAGAYTLFHATEMAGWRPGSPSCEMSRANILALTA